MGTLNNLISAPDKWLQNSAVRDHKKRYKKGGHTLWGVPPFCNVYNSSHMTYFKQLVKELECCRVNTVGIYLSALCEAGDPKEEFPTPWCPGLTIDLDNMIDGRLLLYKTEPYCVMWCLSDPFGAENTSLISARIRFQPDTQILEIELFLWSRTSKFYHHFSGAKIRRCDFC